MDKKALSEADIITKYILPAVDNAGWDAMTQLRQEVKLRDGKVIVRGQMGIRKTVKSADIVLYHKPNMPLAVIEAKANKHDIGKGMQQGLDYARCRSYLPVMVTASFSMIKRPVMANPLKRKSH